MSATSNQDGGPSLQTPDYVVFGALFVFTMAIGVYYAIRGRGNKTRESYFVANRKMHFVPLGLSLVVSFESSIVMLGLPTEIYMYGTGYLVVTAAYLVSNMMTSVVTVPLFKPLGITSVFEYIQQRFQSRPIRVLGVVCSILNSLFYMGVVIFAQAVALEAVMGLDMWLSVTVMTGCAVLYTSLGGIKSVIWTDVSQFIIMFGGVIAIIIKGTVDSGGTQNVWEYAMAGKRLQPINFDPDPTVRHSVWVIMPKILAGSANMFEQAVVQRVCASRTKKDARRMVYLSSSIHLLVKLVIVTEGLVLYAYFRHRGRDEPMSCGVINNPNQIVPYAVLVLFQSLPGMAGLFLAALYSASLSTVSSGLNSMSVLITQDLLEPFLRTTSDARATLYAKISVVFLGGLCVLFCFVVSFVEGNFSQVLQSVVSASSAPLAGLFMMGAFFPSTHAKGAAIGMLLGFILSCTVTMGGVFSNDVKQHPTLPMGNGTCPVDDVTASSLTSVAVDLVRNITTTASTSTTTSTSTFSTMSSFMLNTTMGASDITDSNDDYNLFFSFSYILFAPMGIVLTVVAGLLASYALGPNQPGDVDPKYFIEFSDSVFILLPQCIRRWMKSIGPDYRAGWKKSASECDNEMDHLPTSNT